MSFFETEPGKEALEVSEASEEGALPDAQSCPETQPAPVEEVAREPDALLDGIDALGEFVLALDAQLRAERNRSVGLRVRLSRELAALRKTLQ